MWIIDLAVDKVGDINSEDEIAKAIKTTIAAKQYGNEGFLSKLVAKAVLSVMPKNPTAFNVDNIRVVKIMGGGLEDSQVVKGMVFSREPSGTISRADYS
jgi:T-complex protein 1 subunit theta